MSKDEGKVKFDLGEFIVGGITNHDAPSLYGLNPERDLYTLWKEKVDLTDAGEWSTGERDQILAQAREKFLASLVTAAPVHFQACFGREQAMPFLRAIIDGAELTHGVILRSVVQSAEAHAKVSDSTLPIRGGRVPERHWVEIQHQLLVLGMEKAYLVSTVDGSEVSSVVVRRDEIFVSNHVAECVQFWDHVRRGVVPPGAAVPADEVAMTSEAVTIPIEAANSTKLSLVDPAELPARPKRKKAKK